MNKFIPREAQLFPLYITSVSAVHAYHAGLDLLAKQIYHKHFAFNTLPLNYFTTP